MKSFFYSGAPIEIPATGTAASLAYVRRDSASGESVIIQANNGVFRFVITSAGEYYYQIYANDGSVLVNSRFEVLGAIANGERPLSHARQALEAIEAKIEGRSLTIDQSKITCGDRGIEYINSIEELMRWRDYFRREVNREEGHAEPTMQVFTLKGGRQ